MKTVFDNIQCAHVWAQQTQPKGRTNNGNVVFEGKTIYSYGYHFPMARFLTDDIVLVNGDSYSISTSKQQGYVWQAVSHKTRVYVSTRVIKTFADYLDNNPVLFPPMVQDIVIEEAFRDFDNAMQRASKRRIKRCKTEDIIRAISYLNKAKEIFETLQTPIPEKLSNAISNYEDENSNAIEKHLAEIAAKKSKTKAEQAEKYAKAKALWLAHEAFTDQGVNGYDLGLGFTLLRVSSNGEEIETSRGAKFPLEHAVRAFKIIRVIKDHKGEYEAQHDKGGGYRLGHFKIDKIDKSGNVTAGCHYVPWESIEHCATVLKIYP